MQKPREVRRFAGFRLFGRRFFLVVLFGHEREK